MANPSFVFFGTPELAVTVLEELKKAGLLPGLIVTAPDRPQGKKLVMTSPPVKLWAEGHGIPCLQPEKLEASLLAGTSWDLFIVVAYGKILRKSVLALPAHGTVNVHPSLLPRYRGPAPIEAPILSGDAETGVTIMLLDEEVDHGPILAQEALPLSGTETGPELEDRLARLGGQLLARTIPGYLGGKILPAKQDHGQATFTRKVTKADGLIDLSGDPAANERKIRAYAGWPGTYFFQEHNGKKVRVAIRKARLGHGELVIERVTPEGRKEMPYDDFRRGLR